MNILVDTSVWSQALRRDPPSTSREVTRLTAALEAGEQIFTTGLILQELLQGFAGPRARDRILADFAALPLIIPDRTDHVAAAELRNVCRRSGIPIGTIDALIAALAIRHDLGFLTSDRDFERMAKHCDLRLLAS